MWAQYLGVARRTTPLFQRDRCAHPHIRPAEQHILLAYPVVFGAILGILDWYRSAPTVPDVTPETEVAAAAVSIRAGAPV